MKSLKKLFNLSNICILPKLFVIRLKTVGLMVSVVVVNDSLLVFESVKAANEFELVKFSSFNFVKHLTSNFSR